MNLRPRIQVTREGRYYLFVLAFIVGGAVLREVNLLVVLAALMAGPMLFSWRAVVMTLRRVTFRRRTPTRATAGDSFVVTVTVKNARRSLGSWALTATDEIRDLTRDLGDPSRGEPAAAATPAQVFFARVSAGEEQVGSYRLTLTRRGRYQFGPLRLSTGFPFDFVRGTLESEASAELLVGPRVGRLSKSWQRRLESLQLGQQRSQRRRGLAEGDYYGLREWRPGDSRRWIHWRTSAKLGSASVLQFEELRHRDLALLIDLWRPPEPTLEDLGYVEFAASFAATAVVELCRRGSSELAVAVAGKVSGCWAAAASRVLAQEILDHLAEARPYATPAAGTSSDASPVPSGEGLSAAMRALRPKLRRGARLVVVSTRARESMRGGDEAEFRESPDLAAEWLDVRAPEVRDLLQFDDAREGR